MKDEAIEPGEQPAVVDGEPLLRLPALALDLMEEFRPLIGDSAVLTAINNGEVKVQDFISAMQAVTLTAAGRKRFIEAYERRMSQEITHPIFGYRISYRRVLEVQARLLGRYLAGEIPGYPELYDPVSHAAPVHRQLRHLGPAALGEGVQDHAGIRRAPPALGFSV